MTILRTTLMTSLLLFLISAPAGAFLYELEVLEKKEIAALSDDALIDKYIDVLIEMEASKAFHEVAGFTNPKEYRKHKRLIRYRVDLLREINKRKLDVPKIE